MSTPPESVMPVDPASEPVELLHPSPEVPATALQRVPKAAGFAEDASSMLQTVPGGAVAGEREGEEEGPTDLIPDNGSCSAAEEIKTEDVPVANVAVVTGIKKRQDQDVSELREFLGRMNRDSRSSVSVGTTNFAFILLPMLYWTVVSLVTVILSILLFPLSVGVLVGLKVAFVVCCVFVLLVSSLFVCYCCVDTWIEICNPEDTDDRGFALSLSRSTNDSSTLSPCAKCLLENRGYAPVVCCLLICLCVLVSIVLSGVLGGMLLPLPVATIAWVVFAVHLVVCLLCAGFVVTFGCLVGCNPGGRYCEVYDRKCLCLFTCGCLTKDRLTTIAYRRRLAREPCVRPIAESFVHRRLKIDAGWFEDVECYCQRCCGLGDAPHDAWRQDQPSSFPKLWTRFALPPARAAEIRKLDTWRVAYHGTSGLSAKAIVESQQMLMPGDRRPDGGVIEVRPGHVEDESFARRIFMSPSVIYVSCPFYSIKEDFKAKRGGIVWEVQVALELLVQPDAYDVGPETIGASANGIIIDKSIPNGQLEWSTDRRGVIEVNALLIRVDKGVAELKRLKREEEFRQAQIRFFDED